MAIPGVWDEKLMNDIERSYMKARLFPQKKSTFEVLSDIRAPNDSIPSTPR